MSFRVLIVFIMLFSFNYSAAQNEIKYPVNEYSPKWIKLMYHPESDPAKVINEYTLFYTSNEFVKNEHTQYYKRWLRSFSRNNIVKTENDSFSKENQKYIQRSLTNKSPNSQWQSIGPWDFDRLAESRSYAPGAAHVYTIKRCSSSPNVMYAGTATAGVWKSIDAGQNWFIVTKDLMVNSVFALELDHSDPNIAFFESGGSLYKTINGGLNWSIIGDLAFTSLSHSVKDIIMDPLNSDVIYLTSQNGFYKTTDAGNNWNQILAGDFQEIELHPIDNLIIYTIKVVGDKTEFYKSIDGGLSFVLKPNGWPNPASGDEQKRVEIAVTLAAPSYIYANATGAANGGSGTYGIYFSADAGETWTFRCCGTQPSGPASLSNPNLMGWSDEGTDDGGQYYYDVALAADPVDPDKLYLGGVNHWVSTDGGVSFSCPAKWSHGGSDQYVHADIHDIRFFGNELWIACDGGIFKSSDFGATINRSMLGIEGTDFWGFGASPQSDVMLGGAYHNGTLLKDNSTYINDWICTGGGDGVRGFVNFGNDRIAYDDYQGRILSGDRTVPIGSFQFDSLPNSSYIIGASSRMTFDPRNYNTIYLGRNNLLVKTINNGQTFQTIHDFLEEVMAVEIAWSNPDVIYVVTYPDWWGVKKIWKSSDAGVSWTEITPPSTLLSGDLWVPFDIAVSSNDENILWAARTSQYGGGYPNLDGRQVYKTVDGGTTWANVTSSDLDGESITNITHQRGTDGGVYVGTRRAVYYKNNSSSNWHLFNNNLPLSSPSTKLIPYYKGGVIRNATSRSVYECEFYETAAPQAQIAADKYKVSCFDTTVYFVDNSALSNDNPTWQWSFPGGSPSSSVDQNPIVSYALPGAYDVSLTVSDDYGTSTQSYTAFITYEDVVVSLDLQEDFESGFDEQWRLENANSSYNWGLIDIPNGPFCNPTKAAFIDHYSINQTGDEAELITTYIDLTGVNQPSLHFDYAYATYASNYQDGFRIDISTDCGQNWDQLFYAFGDSLATVPPQGSWWEPSDCSDWSVNNSIDLSPYVNQQIMTRFVAINGYGNNFYLDNINFLGDPSTLVESSMLELKVYPNPSNGSFTVEHNFKSPVLEIFSMDGRLVFNQHLDGFKSTVNTNLAKGVYLLQLTDKINGKISTLLLELE